MDTGTYNKSKGVKFTALLINFLQMSFSNPQIYL